MNNPGWYAQPFRADGGITAGGLLRQLGRPSLSRLTLLVREAAQNSWDARLSDRSVVDFRLDLITVGAGHIAEWRRLFSDGPTLSSADGDDLRRLWHTPTMRYLAVSDRGTGGLAGPTRSDAPRTERREWARFVLNSGDRDGQSSRSSGGTFGYGKSTLFQMSKIGCVLVYTRFRTDEGHLSSRFIGVAIRESYWDGDARYTGRHWWGLPEPDHCEPLHDEQADAVARRLGVPGFGAEETGTTLVVVDPDLTDPSLPETETTPELSIADAGAFLADAAAWNLWPITLPDRAHRMHVTVTANGTDFDVPDSESDASLASFASAYRKATSGSGETLSCGSPRRDLGVFAHEFTFGSTVVSPAARDLGVEGAPRHVCLLRSPELVVRYLAGPERSSPSAGYAAVFKVTDDLDETFSRAEPPTHDAWEHQQLQGREATFVRTAGRRLKERCDALSGAQARKTLRIGHYSMGSIAQRLGHLLAGPGGTGTAVLTSTARPGLSRPLTPHPAGDTPDGAGGPATAGGSPGGEADPGRRRLGSRKAKPVAEPRFELIRGVPFVVQRVMLYGPDRVEASIRVLTGDGGTEGKSPTGSVKPEVAGWRFPCEDAVVAGDVLYHSGGETEVDLIITSVADVLFDVGVTGRS